MAGSTILLAGHYGSGKTNIAASLALAEKDAGRDVYVIDLDIINPYFRLADHKARLAEKGIPILHPAYANTNVDIPALLPEVAGVMATFPGLLIIDVGGDDTGAFALGQYAAPLSSRENQLWLVCNPYRPFTAETQDAVDIARQIEAAGRMRFTGVVANPNLSQETTAQTVLDGLPAVDAIAARLGLPVVRTAVRRDLCPLVEGKTGTPLLPVDIFTKPNWAIY